MYVPRKPIIPVMVALHRGMIQVLCLLLYLSFLVFVLLASIGFVVIPANAKMANLENNTASSSNLLNQTRTRYVRMHGKRYRVTYKLYKRNGRWYYRILSARRA